MLWQPRLRCDDSVTRVLAAEKELVLGDYGKEKKLPLLVEATSEALGRAFLLKNSDRPQKRFNVSVIHGYTDQKDPLSYTVFYRSHNGPSDNLLSSILSMRSIRNKNPIKIQSDLTSQNLPDLHLIEKFKVALAGCAPHARRPFWRFREDDPDLCGRILSYFRLISYVEEKIRVQGLEGKQIIAIRNKEALPVWRKIKALCQDLLIQDTRRKWPRNSGFGKAANYVVKNFPALTAYLDDPHLAASNNISERLLRSETMLLVSCKFRLSENGRVVFDILRTILMTCRATGNDVGAYLSWIGRATSTEIIESPSDYTPAASARSQLALLHDIAA